MTNRRTPKTSHLAHESVKHGKQAMYEKIIAGMEKLRVGGNFEEIAIASNLEPAQCWKRLSEMVDAGTVFNVGITHKTSSGRQAMVRQLISLKNVSIEPEKPKAPINTHLQTSLFGN